MSRHKKFRWIHGKKILIHLISDFKRNFAGSKAWVMRTFCIFFFSSEFYHFCGTMTQKQMIMAKQLNDKMSYFFSLWNRIWILMGMCLTILEFLHIFGREKEKKNTEKLQPQLRACSSGVLPQPIELLFIVESLTLLALNAFSFAFV